jgi:uncharacterized protein with ParB-like and HNH nuclease domain
VDCTQEKFEIKRLVSAWNSGSLKTNQEYQRGASWKPWQMQGLVDSIFRRYPIPPLFLHEITEPGLKGQTQTRYEIVDGQQRIRSLAEYFGDKFPLLDAHDKRLWLPNSLRSNPAQWAKKRYSELEQLLKNYLDSAQAFKAALQTTTKIVEEAIRHSGHPRRSFEKLTSSRCSWWSAISRAQPLSNLIRRSLRQRQNN